MVILSARTRATAVRTAARTRPRPVELLVHGALLALAVAGLLSPGQYSALPAETLLEAVFVLATALSMTRVDAAARGFLLLASSYLVLKTALYAFTGGSAWLDFLQAYKAYFYLVALAFFIRRRVFDGPRLARVTALLVAAFLVKYGYSRALGLDARPGLYLENNFELVLLTGLTYVAFPFAGRLRHVMVLGLAVTVLLSGSRSAGLCLLLVYGALYLRGRNRWWPAHLLVVGLLVGAVAAVFAGRDIGGLQSVDRYHFLQVFLQETSGWPWEEWLTGSYPITPLSPGGCGQLAYYVNEFSRSDPTVCYSVILHSYVLRGVFDQGVLGLALLYTLVGLALRRSGASPRDVVVVLGILTASGLSVSAFNNVTAALLLAVTLGLDRQPAPEQPAPEPARAVPGGPTTADP